ncbi:MAG: HAMP domain-containing sensor histidine kinase [Candidatus Saccharimonadales bacterium]
MGIIGSTPELSYLLNSSKFRASIQDSYNKATDEIIKNLFLMNMFVMSLGGILSYSLAKKTLEPIERVHQSQARFSSDASHELRTPISVMRTEIEVALKNKSLSLNDAKEVLTSNLEEVDRLSRMIDTLLSLSRLQAEEVQLTKFSLNKLSDEIISDYANLSKGKDIKIVKDLELITMKSNKDYLGRAISILIDNAIKYSPEGSTVTIKSSIESNHKVHISVTDQGSGIKPKDQAKIFDRFYRGEESRTKNNVDGVGLGLSLAKEIVTRLKGQIVLQETSTKGSTFAIYLPKA